MDSVIQQIDFQNFTSNIADFQKYYKRDITESTYFGLPLNPILEVENKLHSQKDINTAYFSMEFGIAPSIYNTFHLNRRLSRNNRFDTHQVFSNQWKIDSKHRIHIDKMLDIPIYGGGLGVLAGDTIKSVADQGLPVVALGILWNKGYFKQEFWYTHGQVPKELTWDPRNYPGLVPLKDLVSFDTNEGKIYLRLWKYYVYSYDQKMACPIILIDTNVEENPEHFRKLTDQLYRSDDIWWKLFQRVILGVGGMNALRSLGYNIDCYHLNEGHAAFAILEKLMHLKDENEFNEALNHFVYTCHTPVEAGHDRFHVNDLKNILGDDYAQAALKLGEDAHHKDVINLTQMCLDNCPRVNAVAKKHNEIMHIQFPQYKDKIKAITNGVHVHTWLTESYSNLFDKYKNTFGDWRQDKTHFTKAKDLVDNQEFRQEVFDAHVQNKVQLMDLLKPWHMDKDVLTIGWARRIAGYKRPALIFHNVQRILKIAYEYGPIQLVLAGKAHPNDDIGAAKIEEILNHIEQLKDHSKVVKVLILENYDTYFGKLLTSSVDVWLNNPLPPFEASGTSGMKAILNGVLQVTTLDGWVCEAEKDDIGWIFGYQHDGDQMGDESDLRLDADSDALYDTLEKVASLYYKTNNKGVIDVQTPWVTKMINCLATSAYFNTQRMVLDYHKSMWSQVK